MSLVQLMPTVWSTTIYQRVHSGLD